MSTIRTMTLDEAKKLPPLSEERAAEMRAFRNTDFSDCPRQTEDELRGFRPWYEVHPRGNDTYKVRVTKTQISLRIDTDVLNALKAEGDGYQTRINDILRKAVFGA